MQHSSPHTIRPGGQETHCPFKQIVVLLQARPQAPQLVRLLWTSVHVALQHSDPVGQLSQLGTGTPLQHGTSSQFGERGASSPG
jgi:hypothetical protein